MVHSCGKKLKKKNFYLFDIPDETKFTLVLFFGTWDFFSIFFFICPLVKSKGKEYKAFFVSFGNWSFVFSGTLKNL